MAELRVIIVPSHEVKPVDQLNGTITLARLRKALELWRTGKFDLMILSGGKVWSNDIQTKPFGFTMLKWIVGQLGGPEPGKIIAEELSRDTIENAELSLGIIEEEHPDLSKDRNRVEITIVTEPSQGRRMAYAIRCGFGWPNVILVDSGVNIGLARKLWELWLYIYHLSDPTGASPIVKKIREKRSG